MQKIKQLGRYILRPVRQIRSQVSLYADNHNLSRTKALREILSGNTSEAKYTLFQLWKSVIPKRFHGTLIPKSVQYYWLQDFGGVDTVFNSEADQFAAFEDLWPEGFKIGGDKDLTREMTGITYNGLDFHEIFLQAVQPFVAVGDKVIEIGPGRGAWTKGLLVADEVWVLDAQPLEKNSILEYLGHPNNLKYIQVSDFSLRELPDDFFDFFFSYDCFCHIDLDGIQKYLCSLFPKLKTGTKGVVMISDWDKKGISKDKRGNTFDDFKWFPGCWTPNNSERMRQYVENAGFTVLDADFLKMKRDTLVLFAKP